MKHLLGVFARNTVFANILLLLIFFAGGLASVSMIRESFPEFSFDLISITVEYPGADPEEVEEGVSQKIEEALETVEGVEQYTTQSMENRASVTVEVKKGYELPRVLDQVKSRINAISTFPVSAENPVITEVVRKESVMLLALSGDLAERQIKEWAEQIRDEVKLLEEVSQVDTFGGRDYEIAIELSEERLRQYNLTFDQVATAVRQSSLNLAGGTLRTTGEEIRIRTVGRKYTGEELAQIVIMARPGGELITLDRLAHIDDGFNEDPILAEIDDERAMFVMVYKTTDEDALDVAHAVRTYVETKQQMLPPGVAIEIFYDTTESLQARIDLLTWNGLIGLGLVFFILWLFLDPRLSFWAGMGIPISICGAMFILWSIGVTINMISLFGLIMVLGIVVDDAIVVGEAIYVHRKSGDTPIQAAIEGVSEVAMPILAAVTTTMVAFIPLSYVGGTMGKFVSILPLVVISCLLISLVESLFLLPAHLSHLPDLTQPRILPGILGWPGRMRLALARGFENFVEYRYRAFVSWVLNWRYVSLAVALAVLLLSLGLVTGGLVKFQVFPKLDGFVVTSTVEFPEGTPSSMTITALKEIEAAFVRIGERTTTISGESLIRRKLVLVGQSLSGSMGATGPHMGSVQVILLDSEERGIHSNDLLIAWEKEVGTLPGVKSLSFEGMAAGPAGAEIEVWFQGRDMALLAAAAEDLQERLSRFRGVNQIRSDYDRGKNELQLRLKPEARALGLNVQDLATQVQSGFFGREAFRLQRGSDDIRVKVRYPAGERQRISDLETIRIRTASGHEIPLGSVAEIILTPGYSTITRTDGLRRIVVTGEVNSRLANSSEIFAELASHDFPELKRQYPGLQVSMQGSKKNTRESFASLKVGFPIALVGIFVIIATIFRSYVQPVVILFTIPFGIIGAILGHLLMGYNLSMMSIFGMVALSGVVINSAIVLIERVNRNLESGSLLCQAIVDGGCRRFRAIFLTSMSTVGGLAPLILETDMQARFLIPMALSVAGGVIFATGLTLVLIPSLLMILNDFRCFFSYLRTGTWPEREEVEPRAAIVAE
ncbi:MAG: efflux RND transporter permease subunit [Desulfobulbaceae bacterium]|uniref:Efflux RND transporter permease subunit n=1 Tax=Candidatus Desulfatifera sulfidica TaxID=2841691 RepID=A0A8J6N8T0_9BACT|nr:efflux RND transporter permease subunit [Candidatus Desulfatifera sulfidica]